MGGREKKEKREANRTTKQRQKMGACLLVNLMVLVFSNACISWGDPIRTYLLVRVHPANNKDKRRRDKQTASSNVKETHTFFIFLVVANKIKIAMSVIDSSRYGVVSVRASARRASSF